VYLLNTRMAENLYLKPLEFSHIIGYQNNKSNVNIGNTYKLEKNIHKNIMKNFNQLKDKLFQ
jgi:hypothetical protein